MNNRSLYIGSKDRNKLDKLWEQVHLNGITSEPIADPYFRMLMEDWQRCSEMGIDSNMQKGVLLPGDIFEQIKKDKEFLLYKAIPIVERVRHVISGLPGILIITDDTGTILYISGDPLVRSKAADESNLVEGSRWSESVTGTNGIGTALTKATSVHVYASEHFCRGWHQWTCAASPILNPFTGEPIGVIDFTTLAIDYRDEAVGLAYSVASHISTEIRLQMELERLNLIQSYERYSSRYPSDRILVVDRMGQVVRSSTEINPADCQSPLVGETAEAPASETIKIYMSGTETEIGTLLVDGQESILGSLEDANQELLRISRTIAQCATKTPKDKCPSFASIDRKDRSVNYTLQAVAHEIRNPLTAVGGYARRLAESLDPHSHSGKYAKMILDEALRLERVLSEMPEQSFDQASCSS